MKRWLIVLFFVSFVSASVDVSEYDIGSGYVSFDEIGGHVNLTISGEYYDEEIELSNGESIMLGDFLRENERENGADFDCSPVDCYPSYNASSHEEDAKTIILPRFETRYFGFVLYGGKVLLDSMRFRINSDFDSGVQTPLTIEFFEKHEWDFSNFSTELSPKNWGCFNPFEEKIGSVIKETSSFCEMINIGDSSGLRIGADINASELDDGDVEMTIYFDVGPPGTCEFDPKTDNSCDIPAGDGEIFLAGDYHVCIGAKSDVIHEVYYNLEDEEEDCGFTGDPDEFVPMEIDFGIFAQNVRYADGGAMGRVDFDDKWTDTAKSIISNKYSGDCSNGCILPLKISGASQNFRVSGVNLEYSDYGLPLTDNLVYDLNESAAKVYFNGTLDLGLLGFGVSKSGEYFARLSGEDLFREDVSVREAPIVSNVLPSNAPAGVPVRFYAIVDFDSDEALSYSWNFGDGTTETTSVPYVTHTYNTLKIYTLSIRVSAGEGLSFNASFEVEAISPEIAVGIGLKARRASLDGVRKTVEGLSEWYTSDLLGFLGVVKFESELDFFEDEENEPFDGEEFRKVVVKIYDMDIPITIRVNNFESPYLLSELGDVDVGVIFAASEEAVGGTNEDYAGAILTWQNDNIVAVMKSKEVSASYWKGREENVLTSYNFDVINGWNEESYFVINKPLSELHFKGNVGAKDVDGSTVIVLGAGKKKVIEFYYEGKERGSFFVSPRLSSILIESDISTSCNFNKVCEEALGENYNNCRSDCKPVEKAVLYFVLGLFVFLILYTILQVWYKKHYEGHLFKDRSQLYNLLMYVTNARAGDMSDKDLAAGLDKQGWSSEKIKYVVKKSIGKSVGMVEIIPITRISAWLRNKKAKKLAMQPQAAGAVGSPLPVGPAAA